MILFLMYLLLSDYYGTCTDYVKQGNKEIFVKLQKRLIKNTFWKNIF